MEEMETSERGEEGPTPRWIEVGKQPVCVCACPPVTPELL